MDVVLWLASVVASAALAWWVRGWLDERKAKRDAATRRERFSPVRVEHGGSVRSFIVDGGGPGRGPVELLADKPDTQIDALHVGIASAFRTAWAEGPGEPDVFFVPDPDGLPLVYEVDEDCTWKRRLRGGHGDDDAGRQFLVVKHRRRQT